MPDWPEYIIRDYVYPIYAKLDYSGDVDIIELSIINDLESMGLGVDTKWQLIPNVKFTMDMWDPSTKKKFEQRAGGKYNPFEVPKDAERHETQARLAKKQGGIRKEPVILLQHSNGYELVEGWHRTIQHFNMYPEGYTGPAYVAKADD